MKVRLNSASIQGAFTGCLLTTLAYVLFSSSFTLWSTRRAVSESRTRSLVGSSSIVKDLVLSARSYKRKSDLSMSRTAESTFLSLSHNKRKLVLPVVPTSIGRLQVTYQVLNDTWWQSTGDYKMFVGTSSHNGYQAWTDDNGDSPEQLHEVQGCPDFDSSSGTLWSPSQLFCLLENIYKSFFLQYEWFIITSPAVYLSMGQLERLLVAMDSLSVIYMGHPSPSGHCMGGSGIILSRMALKSIVPHLKYCLHNYFGRRGDEALGHCFTTKLQTKCYVQDRAKEYFVNKGRAGFPITWEQGLSNFITVFPVHTPHDMKSLYQIDLLRELKYHLEKIKDSKERLYGSRTCSTEHVTPQVQPTMSTNVFKRWDAFQPSISYVVTHLEPRDWYDGELRLEMESVSKEALRQYNEKMASNLTFAKIRYGLHRYLGTKGKEYIIDVETKEQNATRLHILRSHKFQPIMLEDSGSEAMNKTIDFVVPLSNVHSRFEEFMRTYEDVCLKVEEKCRLNLVVYGTQDVKSINSSVAKYKIRYPFAHINVIPGKGEFSRGRALHAGISTLSSSDLAFTCDVDMTIERSFLNRCRRNAIQGRRVYYPEVFKYYNMDYVYRFKQRPRFSYYIDRYHGHWCTYGYGMLCIYKSDYDAVGGYDETIEGWGGEDIQLIDTVLHRGFDIMRAPDPALSHRYHPKICSKKLSKNQHGQCLSSRNEDIADTRRLADYVHYLENYCGVKKKVWD